MIQPPRDYQMQRITSKALKYDNNYLSIAHTIAELSVDEKVRVGCIIVRGGQILSQGWNGTASGMPNHTRDASGNTLPGVIHSEANALMKLAKNGGGSDGATIYCTHSPCYDCAKLILQAGIKRVVYSELYSYDALLFMKERGLELVCITPSNRLSSQQDIPREPKESESEYWWGTH